MRMRLVLLLAAFPLLGAAAPAPASSPGPAKDPVATVRAAERQVRLAFQSGGKRADLERVGATFVAWDEVTRRSLPGRFEKLSPADRAAIEKAQRALVEETWFSGLLRPDPLFALAVLGSSTAGTDTEVKTVLQSAGRQARVEFQLVRGKDGRFRVIDLAVNGVSALGGYREQFPQLLDLGGVPHLLETLAIQRRALVEMRVPRNP